ncbi:MAG: type IV pilus inner membrane component PilO [Elusimicrobiota bacterium]
MNLSKKDQQALAAGIFGVAAILGLYIWMLWLPLSGQIGAASKNLAAIKAKINTASREAQKKHRLDMELAELTKEAAEAGQRLPQKKNTADILVSVSRLAQERQVQLQNFSPQKETSRGFFNEIDFSISIRGSYNAIGRFMAAIALQERIFNAADMVYGQPDKAGQIPAHFTLIAYQYKG